jgi:hypothetical protein
LIEPLVADAHDAVVGVKVTVGPVFKTIVVVAEAEHPALFTTTV